MAIFTSLTGLNGASTDLSVIANNIANVGSNGFKKSRAAFGDIFGASALSDPAKSVGIGTGLKGVRQQFTQGSIQATGNTLDLAITGNGFFMTRSERGEESYTRNGAFALDPTRYVVDGSGARLQVFPTNADGVVTASGIGATVPLRVPDSSGLPAATATLDLTLNLPSAGAVIATPFDPANPSSFNGSTSTTVFDTGGNPLTATVYYVRTSSPTVAVPQSNWDAHVLIGGDELTTAPPPAATTPITLTFDDLGQLVAPAGPVAFEAYTPPSGGGALTLSADHGSGTTQVADPFGVIAFTQDGYSAGRLDSVTIDSQGLVRAGFTNGQTQALGKVAVADFANPNGLKQLGDGRYSVTGNSGALLLGEAGGQGLGQVLSGSIERSNVELTEELVNLIVAQRNFQANAKAVETDGTMTQAILNI